MVLPVLARVKLRVHLNPNQTSAIKNAVEAQLDDYLMRYEEDVGGIILAYSGLKVLNRMGDIFSGHPQITFKVTVEFLVLPLKIGSILVGEVNKIGSNHIGILYNGAVNATIDSSKIPNGFQYCHDDNIWSKDDDIVIENGVLLHFKIVRIENISSFQLIGSLRNLGKPILADSPNSQLDEKTKSKVKSKKKRKSSETPSKRKRLKNILKEEEETQIQPEFEETEKETSKTPSKKRKKTPKKKKSSTTPKSKKAKTTRKSSASSSSTPRKSSASSSSTPRKKRKSSETKPRSKTPKRKKRIKEE